MKASDIPTKFNIPFANAAGGGFIRAIPEPAQTGGAASLTDGFPPPNFLPIGAGGIPPFGADMNGILNQISAWTRWQNAGATVVYDAAFSTANGGYPKGAVLRSATLPIFWQSAVDDNTTNPDAGGAGWISLSAVGPTRTITAAGVFVIGDTDVTLGFERSPTGASSTTTPATPANGREIWFEDLMGDFDQNVVLVSAAGGQSIAGLPSFTFNVRRQCGRLKFYSSGGGNGVWSVKL